MRSAATAAQAPRSQRAARLDAAWLAACLIGFLGLCLALRAFVADDAWITERYAQNIAHGLGFVWNPGGSPVEGFSNPLLVALEAGARALGLSPLGVARWVGVACGAGLIVLLHRRGPAIVGRLGTRVAMGVTAFYPPLALWSVGGLETLAMTLATTAGLLLAIDSTDRRGALRAGAVLALLPWLRPEGIVIALAIAVVAHAPAAIGRAGRRPALVRLAFVAGIPLASQLLLEAARLIAYGHLLPNSVIYKAGTGGLLDVVAGFALTSAPLLLLAAAGIAVARGRQRLLVVPPAVYAVGSLGTLDSVNAFNRFLLPAWPALALLAGLGVATAVERRRRWLTLAAAAVAATILGLIGVEAVATSAFARDYASCRIGARVSAASWLRAHTAPTARFAISDAGLVPARAGGRTAIDDFLLNSPRLQDTGALPVAARVDRILRKRPDVLLLLSDSATHFHAPYATDAALHSDRRFGRYRLAHVARGGGAGCAYDLFIYRREPAA